MISLPAGADLRRPEHRREVFLRFYDYHTRFGTHPGLVYLIIPGLREKLKWSQEETLWFSFLNGCTQHPMTSLLLMQQAPSFAEADRLVTWLEHNVDRVSVDTDRRYHRRAIPKAIEGYRQMLRGQSGSEFWADRSREGWESVWSAATSIPTFGRLSAWSFCDYLLCSGVPVEPSTLLLEDRAGSRSHRNGLALVAGRDDLDWHSSNPDFSGRYSDADLTMLAETGESLLEEAGQRAQGQPHAPFINRLTLESALCTYKSFHRPNRRYPNVYADMMHDRLLTFESTWGNDLTDVFWALRSERLPSNLRIEDNPGDPGCVPMKQNWYRETGRLPMMSGMYADMGCEFDNLVNAEAFGRFREPRGRDRA